MVKFFKEMYAESGEEPAVSIFIHTSSGVAMRRTRYSE